MAARENEIGDLTPDGVQYLLERARWDADTPDANNFLVSYRKRVDRTTWSTQEIGCHHLWSGATYP